MAIFQTAADARPGLKLAGLLLLQLAGAPAAGRAQSSPAISIVLSPGHAVPQNTPITATVTLDNLDPGSYSSLVFRADLTEWDQGFPASTSCEGEHTGEDITVEVDASRETFTVEVWKSCSQDIYAHYTLDAALVRLDSSAPGGRVELASAETRFAMSRYLGAGETPPPPPAPGVAAWLDPAPTSFEWKVGEWVEFRARTDILQYLNHHVGVLGFGSEDGARFADITHGADAEEACQHPDAGIVHWRRAINQPVKFVACRVGEATIEVWHETEAERLSTYEFRIRPADGAPGTPGVLVSTTALAVDEGGSGIYAVELASQPTGDVTVSAVDDADTADDTATVSHAVAGANYGSVTAASVAVTVEDPRAGAGVARQPGTLRVPAHRPAADLGGGQRRRARDPHPHLAHQAGHRQDRQAANPHRAGVGHRHEPAPRQPVRPGRTGARSPSATSCSTCGRCRTGRLPRRSRRCGRQARRRPSRWRSSFLVLTARAIGRGPARRVGRDGHGGTRVDHPGHADEDEA